MAVVNIFDSLCDSGINIEKFIELGNNFHELQFGYGGNMGVVAFA